MVKKSSSSNMSSNCKKQQSSGKSSIKSKVLPGKSRVNSKAVLNNLTNVPKTTDSKEQALHNAISTKSQMKITSFISFPKKENGCMQMVKTRLATTSGAKDILPEVKKPVWKSLLTDKKIQSAPSIDVYEISEDEEMQHENQYQKRKIKRRKCSAKNNIKKSRKVLQSDVNGCKGKETDVNAQKFPPLETTGMPQNKNVELASLSNSTIQMDCQSMIASPQSTPRDKSPSFPLEVAANEVSIEFDKETYLSQLAEEIERSFLIPQMTSTPSERGPKEKQTRPNLLDNSLFLTSNEQRACIFRDSQRSINKDGTTDRQKSIDKDETTGSERSVDKDKTSTTSSQRSMNKDETTGSQRSMDKDETTGSQRSMDKDETTGSQRSIDKDGTTGSQRSTNKGGNKAKAHCEDIKLFESPKKKEQKNCKQPTIKFPVKFQEMSFELPSPTKNTREVETSVLEPSKAYTPENHFRMHLARTKKAVAAEKKCFEKKTKEQLIVDKMSKHFEEIAETELCIE